MAFQLKKAAPLDPHSFDFPTGLGGVVTKTSSSQMGQEIRIFLGGLVTRILSVPALKAVPSPLPLFPPPLQEALHTGLLCKSFTSFMAPYPP